MNKRDEDEIFTLITQIEQSNVSSLGEIEGDEVVFDGFIETPDLFRESTWNRFLSIRRTSEQEIAPEFPFQSGVISIPRGQLPSLFWQQGNRQWVTWWKLTFRVANQGRLKFFGQGQNAPSFSLVSVEKLDEDRGNALNRFYPKVLRRTRRGVDGINSLMDRQAATYSNALDVTVIDVGQGALAALHEPNKPPVLFFDLGWPTKGNLKTAPKKKPNLIGNYAPVLLSHWDWDHWGLAIDKATWDFKTKSWNINWHTPALDRPWIVPGLGSAWGGVTIGASHLMLIWQLLWRGNLYAWPSTAKDAHFRYFSVYRIQGGKKGDRNQNGLVGVVHTFRALNQKSQRRSAAILLPGDANYPLMPFLNSGVRSPYKFRGLVATHHGGAFDHMLGLKAEPNAVLAYSAGDTSYGHPRADAQGTYLFAGHWQHQAITKNRVMATTDDVPRGNINLSTTPVRTIGNPLPGNEDWTGRQ